LRDYGLGVRGQVLGFGVRGSGFTDEDLGFRSWGHRMGLGIGVEGEGLRVKGLGFRV
jgi:hypothetical protein